MIVCITGSRRELKHALLDYCMVHFEEEQLWLVDSLQVFDPYYLAGINTERARNLLFALKISRPFTFYQLREKLYSFTKIPLSVSSTIIISAMDCFDDDLINREEYRLLFLDLLQLLKRIHQKFSCKIIIAAQKEETVTLLKSYFKESLTMNH